MPDFPYLQSAVLEDGYTFICQWVDPARMSAVNGTQVFNNNLNMFLVNAGVFHKLIARKIIIVGTFNQGLEITFDIQPRIIMGSTPNIQIPYGAGHNFSFFTDEFTLIASGPVTLNLSTITQPSRLVGPWQRKKLTEV